jgi:hypothetical protein
MDRDTWLALQNYLRTRIAQDLAVAQDAPVGSMVGVTHYSLVSANRSTLAKMGELERAS